jgi:hypothetical protein
MRMPLAAVPDHRDLAPRDDRQVSIAVIENLNTHRSLLIWLCRVLDAERAYLGPNGSVLHPERGSNGI